MLKGMPQVFFRKDVRFMIVDMHTHTFPEKIAASTVQKLQALSHTHPFSDGTNPGLVRRDREAGVDLSVVLPVATNPHQVPHVNDSSVRVTEQFRDQGLLSFGCMHPDFAGWKEELSRIASLGLKGIKIHPVYQGADLDDIRYLRILDRCGELGLIVVTHAGLDVGFPGLVRCSPQMALRAIRQTGPVKFVLAHMGGWRNWDEVEQLLPDTGAYIDTSFAFGSMTSNGDGYYAPEDLPMLGEEQFLRLVRLFGAKRVLFGTDSPWGDQKADLARIRALPLTEEERDAILGENARELLFGT